MSLHIPCTVLVGNFLKSLDIQTFLLNFHREGAAHFNEKETNMESFFNNST
ncbi:hypothetical protein LEP1GSC062_0151 [Leptospira alexanderi serovar Manhao 3 str. L 60]|uniref:Uncharacterized protein n=1 Tax=Leptospira alexanderi serovar Manhao 3 str. L 60 TaxID=1049759 RepID=V6HTX8_9LEPT|nr:hypothetical protein LEP1GSC062_0151 [Leptospira alexanderi serovar Manhao 3 str. L 60]